MYGNAVNRIYVVNWRERAQGDATWSPSGLVIDFVRGNPNKMEHRQRNHKVVVVVVLVVVVRRGGGAFCEDKKRYFVATCL